MQIKTRFAPSPTGYLHIGSVRTALYSWLFARHNNGKFVLRIEDTDLKRSTPEAIQVILDSMKWLHLEWDEGPYFQTERFSHYNSVINEMLMMGNAYKCYCSKKRLDALREKQLSKGKKPRYDSYCRYKYRKHMADEPYVVRFANPQNGLVVFQDQIRGLIKFNNHELDDLIIRRTDGSPTYNFCSVVDDRDMEITHVIRGAEHINNTPRQINIFKALKAPVPIYAHVSVINGEDGKKLSKRHGAISVMQYRDDGYIPEALLNYLVRLGWSKGDQEIFSIKDMIELFSLDSVNKSVSTFNKNKLLWFNHRYINSLPPEYVATYLKWQIEQADIDISNGPSLTDLVNIMGKRCKTLKAIAESCRFFYEDFEEFNINAAKKYLHSIACQPLEMIRDKLTAIDEWTVESIGNAIQSTINQLEVEMSKVYMPLRVSLTGADQSPELDSTILAIGKSRSIARINKALSFIADNRI